MAKPNTPQAIRGTQDIFGPEAEAFAFVVETFERVRKLYRFRRVEMPVFEKTEVFSRSLGETTDVVSKEMYSFLDRGDESLTLRPEFTAGIARAYLTDGWQQRQRFPAAVFEAVHFLRHHVGGLAERAREHLGLLEHRHLDPAEAVELAHALDGLVVMRESLGFGAENVLRAANGAWGFDLAHRAGALSGNALRSQRQVTRLTSCPLAHRLVIASEAKQSRASRTAAPGLLRRCAPRNDERRKRE